jgi:hypothetical protein
MAAITKAKCREIIEDFAHEVRSRRMSGPKPSKEVINFRNDLKDLIERDVYQVPIEILRFRKDNGRIASDVMDHERNIGVLRETDERAQEVIAQFLKDKDPQKTSDLRQSILHAGQSEPAIITCDGFLINGNRRKMVMDQLHKDHPEQDRFAYMKCVILPGKNEEGGPPTLLEIEKLENRYQLQSDGKSEYYGFDRALSIKRKIDLGLSLRDQLRDDPRYAEATEAQLERAVAEYEKDYLRPLDCVDRYLKQFRREGYYRTISTGMSDPEGRWQAFKDYSEVLLGTLANPKKRPDTIDEEDIGVIEEAAFDIIRLRSVPDMPKVHVIMRNLAKYCKSKAGKKEICKIADEVEPVLPKSECVKKDGTSLPLDDIDAKWATKNCRPIIHHLKKAAHIHDSDREKETPLSLLEAAHKKLTHDDMDISSIINTELKRARELVVAIKERAHDIESEIYRLDKERKKFLGRKDD